MIKMRDITKCYQLGGEKVHALDRVSFDIDDGEYVAIIGPSGSGKSTLMNIIGCLDVQDSGTYHLDGVDTSKYSGRQLARLRSTHIGFIFQGFNLLGKLNALENVELPLIYQGVGRRQRRRRAEEALSSVGLSDRMKHRPSQLSGGQQQRVAIARALVANPHLILADEPTGNLDTATGNEIMGLFEQLHEQGNTIVLITHDRGVAARAQRALRIVDGRIQPEENQEG
ncbi:MAG: ABC transporter ATP-binding protein [Bacillota bacterium]|nr:ABC transporter ATP-binding protein [Bacillota bacterium]